MAGGGATAVLDGLSMNLSIDLKTHPDGSVVQLTMPKPADLDGQSGAKAAAMVARLARRLLVVATEDLA